MNLGKIIKQTILLKYFIGSLVSPKQVYVSTWLGDDATGVLILVPGIAFKNIVFMDTVEGIIANLLSRPKAEMIMSDLPETVYINDI